MNQIKPVILSVIIPVYNGAKYINKIMKMIEEQQFEAFEVLIIDDGSSDQTYPLCKEYERQHSWLSVIHTENHGVSHARNRGLDAASGKWIQFMDADDRIRPGMFCDFYRVLCKTESELAVCGCARKNLYNGHVEVCGPAEDKTLREGELKQLFDHMTMENRYWLLDYVWNKWYRRDIIENYKLRFDEELSLGEDFVFNTQYIKNIGSISLLAKRYYEYLVGENGLVGKFRERPWIGRNILLKSQTELYKTMKLWEENKMWISRQAGEIAFGDIRTINRKNCRYKWKDKRWFIRGMMDSDQYPLILSYLKGKSSLLFRIYYVVFSSKNEKYILMLIELEKIGKRIINRKS